MDTVWDMVLFYPLPPLFQYFLIVIQRERKGLLKLKLLFGQKTGKKYGPQFIDIGLAIGEELLDVTKNDFAHLI